MKRHMRDVHADKTDSTSPPPKKKKNKVEDSNDSIVEMEIETKELKDLSFKLEEIEIDRDIIDPVSRRKMQDDKIKEKGKKYEDI